MSFTKNVEKSRDFLFAIIIIQITVIVATLSNIMIIRQVVTFFYLTFVPGFVIIRLLKLEKLDMTEIIFFSTTLSLAFLMLVGLLINELNQFGILKPLSLWPLVISINLTILLLTVLGSIINREEPNILKRLKIPLRGIVFFILPVLSVSGTLLVNASQSNSLLLLMIVVIAILIVLSAYYDKMSHFYPLILLLVCMSILFSSLLVTNYIIGWDEWSELHVFRLTKNNSYWNLRQTASWNPDFMKTNAMASVTMLPTVYSELMNLESTWVFKIVYPFIVSFMVLGLYQLYKTQTDKKTSLLASFFYLSATANLAGPLKQLVAQLFIVSLFLLIFKMEIRSSARKVMFVVLGLALIVSHYSVAFLFLLTIFLVYIYNLFSTRFFAGGRSTKISISSLALFSAMIFSWYIYVSASGPFYGIVDPIKRIFENFSTDLFDLGARGDVVLKGIGIIEPESILHQIGTYIFWLTELLVLAGFVKVILKRRQVSFDRDYITMITFYMAVLISNVVVPNLANAFRMERFYQVSLIILAPLSIVGIEAISKHIFRLRSRKTVIFLAVIILVPFFFFRTGFIYEIAKVKSYSLPLSMYRMNYLELHGLTSNDQDVFGAFWLSKYTNTMNCSIYSDKFLIDSVLYGYGMINKENTIVLSNTTRIVYDNKCTYLYLGKVNTENRVIVDDRLGPWNTSKIANTIAEQNKIYSNGGCEIYEISSTHVPHEEPSP